MAKRVSEAAILSISRRRVWMRLGALLCVCGRMGGKVEGMVNRDARRTLTPHKNNESEHERKKALSKVLAAGFYAGEHCSAR